MQEEFEKDFLEVERKYEVDKNLDLEVLKDKSKDMIKMYQGYFVDEDGRYKRIRLQTSLVTGERAAVVCEKTQVGVLNGVPLLKEVEVFNPYDYGVNLINEKQIKCIEKTRYLLPLGKYTMEVDTFENLTDEFKDWISAEVEFKSERELLEFEEVKLPDFVVRELTGDKKYSNSNMSKFINKDKVHFFEAKAKMKM